ncbi:hypothetical protein V8C86DRAFT_128130 [Haematococcus lacustris]
MQGARKLYQPEDITSRLNMMNSDVARNLLRELRELDTPWGAESRPGPDPFRVQHGGAMWRDSIPGEEDEQAPCPLELDDGLLLICMATSSVLGHHSSGTLGTVRSSSTALTSAISLQPQGTGLGSTTPKPPDLPTSPPKAGHNEALGSPQPLRKLMTAVGASKRSPRRSFDALSLTPRSKSTVRSALQVLKDAFSSGAPPSTHSGLTQDGGDGEDPADAEGLAAVPCSGAVSIIMPPLTVGVTASHAYLAKLSRMTHSMAPAVVEELHSLLEAAYSSWTYDSFALAAASQGHPLSALLYFLLHRSGLMTRFRLDPLMTARFARALEAGYQDQPYHNKIHAADVLQTLHVVLTRGGLVPGYADPLTLLACLLAGAAHDLQHSGLTNDFLVATEHPLALLYNDKSPAENHHLATLFSMLRCPELALLAHLPKQERDKMRKIIIELIMGTDMKQHFTITSSFANLHRLPAEKVPLAKISLDMARAQQGPSPDKVPIDEAERLLSLQVALKISDLGSSAETFEVNRRWVAALQDEFFAQGDQEKAAGLPVSALMDRDKPGAASVASQLGWYSFVAIPLFYNFTRVFPNAEPLMSSAMATYRAWRALHQEDSRHSSCHASHTSHQDPQPAAGNSPDN